MEYVAQLRVKIRMYQMTKGEEDKEKKKDKR